MLRRFWHDCAGQYAIATAIAALPIFGALSLGVDYSEMSRQRHDMLNALDAAGIATAREILSGAKDEEAQTYAWDFFAANFSAARPGVTALSVSLPSAGAGGGTLKLSATHDYQPYFLDTFRVLLAAQKSADPLRFSATAEIRLKNTLEVAMVLDNSGSMDTKGTGSGKKRIDLLKDAAKQLVDTLAAHGAIMKQVARPVQFSLVPFSSAVNVGPGHAAAPWMDAGGISPVHHENFDWSELSRARNANRYAEQLNGVWHARGSAWGTWRDKPLTRFTMFDTMQRVTSTRTGALGRLTEWWGCVETRPYPLNVNDEAPRAAKPESLFVPMFAPDETSRKDGWNRSADNNWLSDDLSANETDDRRRQRFTPKYWPATVSVTTYLGENRGPNSTCTTKPITPLTDVTTASGLKTIKDAIDAMLPTDLTNVPEGLAWGWRTLSSGPPFTEGRSETERGNDKVVIVLTDGANTYFTPAADLAGNRSIYSAYGYAGTPYNGQTPRIFMGTGSGVRKNDFSSGNYTRAMNEHFAELCTNAKGGNLILMTVALDLNIRNATEKGQIDALSACASASRFRKNPDGTPAKLFWNATGGSLADDFKSIADELSNLRIVG
ncbi:MAG: hypothetical protein DI629_14135 [Mesorhizobium amorphae]|nr:MAG: hypothetical protein DI629_14135 [Mesorhizobium amorphae]